MINAPFNGFEKIFGDPTGVRSITIGIFVRYKSFCTQPKALPHGTIFQYQPKDSGASVRQTLAAVFLPRPTESGIRLKRPAFFGDREISPKGFFLFLGRPNGSLGTFYISFTLGGFSILHCDFTIESEQMRKDS